MGVGGWPATVASSGVLVAEPIAPMRWGGTPHCWPITTDAHLDTTSTDMTTNPAMCVSQ